MKDKDLKALADKSAKSDTPKKIEVVKGESPTKPSEKDASPLKNNKSISSEEESNCGGLIISDGLVGRQCSGHQVGIRNRPKRSIVHLFLGSIFSFLLTL